mgnify:CR=1 FL=1
MNEYAILDKNDEVEMLTTNDTTKPTELSDDNLTKEDLLKLDLTIQQQSIERNINEAIVANRRRVRAEFDRIEPELSKFDSVVKLLMTFDDDPIIIVTLVMDSEDLWKQSEQAITTQYPTVRIKTIKVQDCVIGMEDQVTYSE